jgi:flagellin-like hook-associated protein FlgL
MNVNKISDLTLLHMNTANKKLMEATNKASTGKIINQASDSPSDYYSVKMLEKEVKLSEVYSKLAEREMNAGNTQSTLLDSASNLAMEMNSLANAASDTMTSAEEKGALQMQFDQTSQALDKILQDNKLGSAADLGLNNLKINGTAEELNNAKANTNSAFSTLLVQNQAKGTTINQLGRKITDNQQSLVNTKASLSSIRDADLANEAINIGSYKIIQSLALYGVQNSQSVQKSVLNLFG